MRDESEGAVAAPTVTFALAILVSCAYSFVTFIVAVVHFSDPLVDPWFNSKLLFLGFCLLVLQLPLVAARIDFWMHVRSWKYPASQVILQVRSWHPELLSMLDLCLPVAPCLP